MPVHQCPVCGAVHEVHTVLHALAYGRQLTCSPRCKADWPGRLLAGLGAATHSGSAYLSDKADREVKETAC